ncbi:EndoU domain-containing protein [Erwinia rhapontici]|uniref:EndoU domain-containing protein n=1 Tax=Erwinia rhapontici TaxID=55212 RepID=UPI0021671804|nr:EndoU domain-containing protein [Erwinia rhapontici]MCS3608506.1 hypothetical protein [Erwinia rhapontici]
MGSITDADRDQAQKDWVKAHPGQTPDESAINGQVYQNFYDQAFNATGLGTGGAVQQGIQAATAVVQGLAGGDIAAAIANGSAPYLAEAIGHRMGIDNNPEAKAVAHAIVGAALAAAQGQNAAAGATGAALGEITAGILKDQLYGKDAKIADLTETQKQTLSALATLSSGLAGGLPGDSTESAVYAAQAGKTTAENNLMGGTEEGQTKFVQEHGKDVASCTDNPTGAACQRGQAMNEALIVALPAGLGGGVLAAATPEIAAILKAGIESCSGALALCINNLGLQASEIIVPGGVGAGGAVGIGKTAAEAAAAKAETVAANAAKNNPSWKAGDYLDDFKPSPTPLELVKEQAGKGSQTAYIRMDHILNGEVKTLKDGTKAGSGGHYIRDSNIKVDKVTGTPDSNGVSTGYISVRDPATGQWINKKAETTFFPEQWSKRQTAQEIESAFKNSERIPNTEMWSGKSSSGVKIQGYYGKPDGTGATAWPVYTGRNK